MVKTDSGKPKKSKKKQTTKTTLKAKAAKKAKSRMETALCVAQKKREKNWKREKGD